LTTVIITEFIKEKTGAGYVMPKIESQLSSPSIWSMQVQTPTANISVEEHRQTTSKSSTKQLKTHTKQQTPPIMSSWNKFAHLKLFQGSIRSGC